MLDVQQVRLRFIFVRALYPVSLFSKALAQKYTVHLHRLFSKALVQRYTVHLLRLVCPVSEKN